MRARAAGLLVLALAAAACRPAGDTASGNGTAAPRAPGAAPAEAAAAATSVITPGEPVPASVLAGARHWQQEGAAGSRILVVTFGWTRCPSDSACGESERRFRALQDQLRGSSAMAGTIGLLTLSVDPGYDMPAVLRTHAETAGAIPDLWRFAALPAADVAAVLARFGTTREAPVTAVVDAEGRLARLYASSEWTPESLAQDVQSLVLRAEPAVLAAYIEAQEALSTDNLGTARRALARLTEAVREPAVRRLAKTASDGRTLDAVRVAFKPLSEAFVRLPWPSQYQPMYCPMFDENRGATWVQKAGPVINPYYGQAMLRCGSDLSTGAHTDHSPKNGGMLFMAADGYHHVEGLYLASGVFKVFVYDNFKQPMAPAAFRGTVEAGGKAPMRLAPSADGRTLEARIGTLPFPSEVGLTMAFGKDGSTERFDFIFVAPSATP